MRKFLALVAVIPALGLIACGGTDLSTEDAHDTRDRCRYLTRVDQAPGTVKEEQANVGACLDDRQKRSIAFPNHFANVALACDGYGHRIYTTTRDYIKIIADPSCPGWTENTPKMGVVSDAGDR